MRAPSTNNAAMKRRLFNLAMAASLLLAALCLAGWVRSFWVADTVTYVRADFDADAYRGHVVALYCAAGGIMLVHNRSNMPDIVYFHEDRLALREHLGWNWETSREFSYPLLGPRPPPAGSTAAYRWGFQHTTHRDPGVSPTQPGRIYETITFPWWLPTLMFMTIPVPAFIRLAFRRRRRRRGLCLSCGYDLRATPPGEEGGRCPECGTFSTANPKPAT
jgi:hypothetical protein